MNAVLAVNVLGWDISTQTVVIGMISGLTYALLAAGLVLIYRANGIINFAHGEVGAFGAAVFAKLMLDEDWGFLPALVVAVAIGLVIGTAIDLVVVRRLFHASRVVLLVATIGVSQVLLFGQTELPRLRTTAAFPRAFDSSIDLGSITLRGEHLFALVVVPLVIAGLAWFLTRSEAGLSVRAAADNADAARLAGINIRRVSTLVWMLAGGLAVLTFLLNAPIRGTIAGVTTQGLGPSLLLRALAAAMVGRFMSLPLTLAGGIAIGVFEAVCLVNVSSPGSVEAIMFVALLVLLLLRMRRVEESTGGGIVQLATTKGRGLQPAARRAALISAAVLVVLLPIVVTSPSRHLLYSKVAIYALIGLSVVVITGWAGQLSLCQFAFVGVGAVMTNALVGHGVPYGWAMVYAVTAGVVVALVVGAPALRARGLLLAIATLGFAVAATGWLLPLDRFFPGGGAGYVPRGSWWILDLDSNRSFYYFTVVVVGLAIAVVQHLRRTGIGRTIIAVRENEPSAAAMTVPPSRTKLMAFAISGALAALAGGLLAGATVQFSAASFSPDESLRVIAMTIIGGVGSAGGAVVGAVYLLGLPALFGDTTSIRLLTSGIGLLGVLLIRPGGLAQLGELWRRPHDRARHVENIARAPSTPIVMHSDRGPTRPTGEPALACRDVTVRFGGLIAVDDVSVGVEPGEIVGLIGTNGAGKSTLLNAISGFVPVAGGTIELLGQRVDELEPAQRAALGVGRVFQDARLYGALTPREAVAVALEAVERTELIPSALALGPSRRAERAKTRRADELLGALGLGDDAEELIVNLSTGTRRLVEMGCLLAVEPRLLLLDEPTAGMAEAETTSFLPLVQRVQSELGAAVVLIEHDMGVIMSLSDRLYCMEAGRVIAEGSPADVRRSPAVIASYLGGSVDASGTALPPTRDGLVALARSRGIAGASRMRKNELVSLLGERS